MAKRNIFDTIQPNDAVSAQKVIFSKIEKWARDNKITFETCEDPFVYYRIVKDGICSIEDIRDYGTFIMKANLALTMRRNYVEGTEQ